MQMQCSDLQSALTAPYACPHAPSENWIQNARVCGDGMERQRLAVSRDQRWRKLAFVRSLFLSACWLSIEITPSIEPIFLSHTQLMHAFPSRPHRASSIGCSAHSSRPNMMMSDRRTKDESKYRSQNRRNSGQKRVYFETFVQSWPHLKVYRRDPSWTCATLQIGGSGMRLALQTAMRRSISWLCYKDVATFRVVANAQV